MHIAHNRVTFRGDALQQAARQMLGEHTFTHWLTLNFHQPLSADSAQRCLKLWTKNMQARLFRSKPRVAFREDPFFFFAFPEDTKKLEPHFHLPMRIADSHRAYFERLATPVWTRIVPSGTAHLLEITGTDIDHQKVITYATKQFNRGCSHDEFLTSTMLAEPVFSATAGGTS